MAMDENPGRGINEKDRIRDLHKATTRRGGIMDTSRGDVHPSRYDPFLSSPSQSRSPDDFPVLSGKDRNHIARPNLASDFWSRGVANWRALDTSSNGNKKNSNSTALHKKPGHPPTDRDTAESAPAHSRDQSYRSRILSFVESNRLAPRSFFTMPDEISNHRNEPPCPSLGDFMANAAPDLGERHQELELKGRDDHSTTSRNRSNSPTKSRDGKEYDSLMGTDAMSSHAGRAKSPITSLKVEKGLQGQKSPENPSLPFPETLDTATGPTPILVEPQDGFSISNDEIRIHCRNHLKYRDTTNSPASRPPLVEPRSVAPITPTMNHRVRHLKSLSAGAPAFHPRSPTSSHTTPTRCHSKSHGRSVSIETRHSKPIYVSVTPDTPLGQRSLQPSRQRSMATPSVPVEPGIVKSSEGASQPFMDRQYPKPHQHTPEEQGLYFGTQKSMPPQIPNQLSDSLGSKMPPFSSPVHDFDNNTFHYNAQVYEQGEQNAEYSQSNHFDSYATSQAANLTPNAADLHQNGNVYNQDTNGYGQRYYSNHTDPPPELKHNLYTPLEPHREPLKPNQRTAKDLFIPEDIRMKLHKKTQATLRVFAVMNIPAVEHYHTLTPLTSSNQQQSQTLRGYSSTVYKAVSAKDGKTYCLRRIHDFQATNLNENAILAVRPKWAAVRNSNVVSPHFAFTTTNFDDSCSLVIVSDYHPDSITVAEKHIRQTPGRPNRNPPPTISEQILWSYVVQITNALKAIHYAQLAVRVIEPTKVISTDEGRIRLNGCALEDLLDSEVHDIADLQRLDFHKFGMLILSLGTINVTSSSRARAPDVFAQNYSKTNPQLQNVVQWLLDHDRPENNEGIDVLIKMISFSTIDTFDNSLRANDELYFSLNKEIENSRIVRVMTKLNCLNERPEYEHDRTYSTQGPRAVLGLFRDFVFHQVDAQANPVVDMGHILSCLNKLDAGIEERIALTARDEQSVIVVSYKELKGALEGTWQELVRRST